MSEMYYKTLCDSICNTNISVRGLEVLKTAYSNEIRSIRRTDAIKSLKDLLTVLRKRASIGPENVLILEQIARALNIAVPSPPQLPSGINRNVSPPILRAPSIQLYNHTRPVNGLILPPISASAKLRVYDLIAKEIGTKWRDLGRQLNIREGELNSLEENCRHISERMYKILYYFEDTCDKRQWKTKLLNALVNARRKDLKNEAETIFDTHE